MPAPDAVSVMLLPVVATSVEDDAVQDVPFHTPSCRPTIWAEFGASPTMAAVMVPRLEIEKACVKAPFFDSVPEKLSVTGVPGPGAIGRTGLLLHAPVARATTARRATPNTG